MAKIIVWNRKASNKFNDIINYLEREWGDQVTRNFVIKTYQIIELLAQYPEMGTLENAENISGVLLSQNITHYFIEKKIIK